MATVSASKVISSNPVNSIEGTQLKKNLARSGALLRANVDNLDVYSDPEGSAWMARTENLRDAPLPTAKEVVELSAGMASFAAGPIGAVSAVIADAAKAEIGIGTVVNGAAALFGIGAVAKLLKGTRLANFLGGASDDVIRRATELNNAGKFLKLKAQEQSRIISEVLRNAGPGLDRDSLGEVASSVNYQSSFVNRLLEDTSRYGWSSHMVRWNVGYMDFLTREAATGELLAGQQILTQLSSDPRFKEVAEIGLAEIAARLLKLERLTNLRSRFDKRLGCRLDGGNRGPNADWPS